MAEREQGAVPRRKRSTARLLLVLALAVAAALGAVAGAASWWAGAVVPAVSGRHSMPGAGLQGPVTVDFDGVGVPHVRAETEPDLWTAVGYVHGRERLWQMELYRRAASGGLSELFGEALLPADRRFLRLSLRRAAEAELARLSPRTREILNRYAAGVQAAVRDAGRFGLPVEFLLLGVRPRPWTPVDTLLIGKLMAWRLGENHTAELVRLALLDRLSGAQVDELMGRPPEWAPTVVGSGLRRREAGGPALPASPQDRAPARNRPRLEAADLDAYPQLWPDPVRLAAPAVAPVWPRGLAWLGGGRGLSNSWVVSGRRTATGRPLLANDPHLPVELPGLWYEVHLVAETVDAAGVTIPGVPWVVIGHNRRIAWGLTNAGIDVQDFTRETLDLERGRYREGGGWVPLESVVYEIPVRRRAPERFEVLATRRGPVAAAADWSDLLARPGVGDRVREQPLSLRWDVIERGETLDALDALGRAGDWPAFLEAVRRLGAPAQNVVYADVDGNVGYALSGLVPRRGEDDGAAPSAPGARVDDPGAAVPSDAWLPSDLLPAVLNPPAGLIVTANNEIDRDAPFRFTRDWTGPFRARRILQLLGDRERLDMAAFRAVQLDELSAAAELVLPVVHAAGVHADGSSAAVDDVLARLRRWDGRVDGRPVVTLYELFVAELWRAAFADDLGDPLFEVFYQWASRERFAGLYMILEQPQSAWWDDVTTPAVEDREAIVRRAAAMASRRFSALAADARGWDQQHQLFFDHPLGQGGRVLEWFFSRGPVPASGDGTTVNKTAIDWDRPYRTAEAASYRQILDVGGWDGSEAVLPAGQSGHPRSPHYFDQNRLWRSGQYHNVPYSRSAVEAARVSTLTLTP